MDKYFGHVSQLLLDYTIHKFCVIVHDWMIVKCEGLLSPVCQFVIVGRWV